MSRSAALSSAASRAARYSGSLGRRACSDTMEPLPRPSYLRRRVPTARPLNEWGRAGMNPMGAATRYARRRGLDSVPSTIRTAFIVLIVAACSTGVAAKDVPPTGQIWFGQSFDTQTFALTGQTAIVGQGQPFSFVAHLPKTVDASALVIRVSYNGAFVGSSPANAKGTGDVWGFTPGPLAAPGQWRYDLADVGGNVLATGTVTAQ